MSIYNVVINSNNGTGFTNNKNYYFDWGSLPDSKYIVEFDFFSSEITIPVNQIPILFIKTDLPILVYGNNTGIANYIGIVTTNNSFVGNVNYFTTSNILQGNKKITGYLPYRPYNNNFSIQLLNTQNQLSPQFNNNTTTYTLTLTFKQIN